uniref:Uncharacterized protein n=1 Tax=Anguilla anguilla TaxID=7936 RepID=A0A0E9RMF7_ANGAN
MAGCNGSNPGHRRPRSRLTS